MGREAVLADVLEALVKHRADRVWVLSDPGGGGRVCVDVISQVDVLQYVVARAGRE